MKIAMKGAALLLGIGFCNMAVAASYTITDLGTLGGSDSRGNAINNAGQVTGWSYDASFNDRAFIYRDGTMIDLGTLGGSDSRGNVINDIRAHDASPSPSGPDSQGYSINDAGHVTGWSRVDSGNIHAFLYRDGTMTDLGTLGGGDSWGNAINNAGQVVGSSRTPSGNIRAFLYGDGTMTDLGPLDGSSWGYAINNAGQVTGWSQNASLDISAFLYSDGMMTELGTLSGGWSVGNAINDAGQVTGYSTSDPFDITGSTRAFLYRNGTMTDLGLGEGRGINNLGQVVGITRGTSGRQVAALFNDGTVTDLNTLIPPELGWLLLDASDINEAGQITGRGFIDFDKDGIDGSEDIHAYLLTQVPVPAAVWLLGSGLLGPAGMSFAQRRRSASDGVAVQG